MIAVSIVDAGFRFTPRSFLKPLRISTGTITELIEATAFVRVRGTSGLEATGEGNILLSDLWAWPDPTRPHAEREAAMRGYCERLASELPTRCGHREGHPIVLGMNLFESLHSDDGMPVLARSVCSSPLDAALHDATGKLAGLSAFELFEGEAGDESIDRWFPESGAFAAIRNVIQPPRNAFDAWHLVGASDDLDEVLREWRVRRGYRAFKIKVLGRDAGADAQQTVAVYRKLSSTGTDTIRLSIDSNEANPDAASVADYLEAVRTLDPDALRAIDFLEQPTSRDIIKNAQNWVRVSKIKPVMLDEGLSDMDLLPIAAGQGWSGLALKTCKGHSFTLLAAAWAHARGMKLSVQDLTNPGHSFLHAALLASRLPSVNGAELNSIQFMPEANAGWSDQYPSLFGPFNGRHEIPDLPVIGLHFAR